jgi:prepilin-type N-terminal cleavage/methylation domain-containing protein
MIAMHKHRQSAFTLVEIMIVVLIIGLLATLAVPNFLKSRSLAQKNGCIDNLRLIQGAVTEVLFNGGVPSAETIYGPENLIKFKPKCPANKDGPDYEIPTDDDTLPTCPNSETYPEHRLTTE